MLKGLGHGELMLVDEAADRIEGTLRGFEIDGVFGSREMGLKKTISFLMESGEEQSLGVPEEFPCLLTDSVGFELVDAVVADVLGDRVNGFARKVRLRFSAVLNIFLNFDGVEALLLFGESLKILREVGSI